MDTKLNLSVVSRIRKDLGASRISLMVVLAFVPLAFLTFLFHEAGHWTFGELTGNEMLLGLNNSAPQSSRFIRESDALWSAIGGPLFTILQALGGMIVAWETGSIYAYSATFFAVFSRFFSIILGGIDLQDEARIAGMTGISKYIVAAFVLLLLGFILAKIHRKMRLDLKALGYFTVLGVMAILLVQLFIRK